MNTLYKSANIFTTYIFSSDLKKINFLSIFQNIDAIGLIGANAWPRVMVWKQNYMPHVSLQYHKKTK